MAGIRPVIPGGRRRCQPRCRGFPAAFRLPAFASWASCSCRGLPLSLRSAYQAAPGPRQGFHVPHIRVTAGLGALFTPRPSGALTASPIPPAAARPLCQGPGPITPACPSISRDCLLRGVIKGSLAFTRPAFPLAFNPRMERGPLGLATRASHPCRQDLRRTPERGTGIEHSPGATRPALPDLQFMS